MKKLILLLFFALLTNIYAINLQKAETFDSQNIDGWLVSEKLDGIRAYWNGEKLYTRKGVEIFAPKWFTKNLPTFELDGELWTKRDNFENIQSIVMDKNPSNKWREITYNIFEVPNAKGDFLQRLQKAKKWFKTNSNKHIKIVPQLKFKNTKELNKIFDEVVQNSGEGVMIKNPKLSYSELLKTKAILKYKKFEDAEGVVIGYNYNKNGKFKSLVLELSNNIKFNLGGGFSNKQRENPPKIGEVVRFKYYGWTKYGKPKFASFLNIRKD